MNDRKNSNDTPDDSDIGPAGDAAASVKGDHSQRIQRKRKGGLLSFRNIAILTVLIVGGAIGYEVWKNPDLIGPSRLSRTPNVDDTPAGDQWCAFHQQRYKTQLMTG